MVSGGKIGRCQNWYLLMVAAKWIGVPPWVLEEKSVVWRQRALLCFSIEKQVAAEERKGLSGILMSLFGGRR